MWLVLAVVSIVAGIVIDFLLKTPAFPVWLRGVGFVGMILAHVPLKRTGKLLNRLGASEQWGCTTRLVTIDIYQCVRHPHHLGVGIFMTSLGLFIGHPASFFIVTINQWIWVLAFLLLVEERELLMKFGKDYEAYRQKTPFLIPKPLCFFRILTQKLEA